MIVPSAAASVLAVALWAAAAVAQPATAPAWEKMGVQAYQPPKPAPAFTLPGLDGRAVSLDDQKGKALLLFLWATW